MADTPASPSSGPLPTQPNLPLEDLSGDKLLRDAPRVSIDGLPAPVPSLAGIPLLARVGRGGMGAVYYGVHPRLGKHVAVKVLPFHLADQQPELIERFQREARFAARVRSPHLVDVSDVNEEQGLHYIVMEYVHGVSAAGYLKETKAAGRVGLAEPEALAIVIAACKGLAAAHGAGVVHRDVKPDNVLIPRRADGSLDFDAAKLADLGLARSEDGGTALTVTQAAMGTPGYMAPEQGMDVKSAGKPADVFGAGATLYALLSGNAPFKGSSPMQVMMVTAQSPHIPIASYRQDLQELTRAVVNRCLEKRPEDRYPDAAVLLAELDRARSVCLGHTPPPPSLSGGLAPTMMKPTSISSAPASVQPAQTGKRRGAGLLAAVVLLCAAGAGVWWWASQNGQPSPPVSPPDHAQADPQNAPDTQSEHEVSKTGDPAGPVPKNVDPEAAKEALNLAIRVAADAKEKGQWKDVVVALEDPLEALGDAEHPLRAMAEGMLRKAQDSIARETRFKMKLAEGETFFAQNEFEKAIAAYLASVAAWPEVPAERRRLAEEGLAKARAGKQGGALAAAKQSLESVLKDVHVDKQRTFRGVPLAKRNAILDAALNVLALDPNDAKAEDVRDAATGYRQLVVDPGRWDMRVSGFDGVTSVLLERPVFRLFEVPGTWLSLRTGYRGRRMWLKWEDEEGWAVRLDGCCLSLESASLDGNGDVFALGNKEKVVGLDATDPEGQKAFRLLPAATNLRCAIVKDLSDKALVAALSVREVTALTITDGGDLEPLRRLKGVRLLDVGASAKSLAPLEALTDLEALRYEGQAFEGAAALAKLPNLRHLAVEALDGDDTAFVRDLRGLRTLVVADRMPLSALAMLAGMEELELLSIRTLEDDGDDLDEAAIGRVLGRLRRLSLRAGEFTSLKMLKQAPHLTAFSCAWRTLKDLDGLPAARGLVALAIQGSAYVQDFSPVGALPHLRYLSLSGNERLDSIAFAANLSRLKYLSTLGCGLLSDLKPVVGLRDLESLVIEHCPLVRNLDPLVGLTDLRALFLNGCASVKNDELIKILGRVRRDHTRFLHVLSPPPALGEEELALLTNARNFNLIRTLVLQDLGRLTHLDALSSGPPNLQVLNCLGLEKLDLGTLAATEDLLMANCTKLARLDLSEKAAEASKLKALQFDNCSALSDVECLKRAAGLRSLRFFSCRGLDADMVAGVAYALPKCRVEMDGERVAPVRPVSSILDEAKNYRNGWGVPLDLAKAVPLYREAAERGSAEAQFRLGKAYVNGEGVPQDYRKALPWLEKAVQQNHPNGTYVLGYAYFFGHGVAEDRAKAVDLYRRAAEGGSSAAKLALGKCYLEGMANPPMPKDEKKGFALILQAAESGLHTAQHKLGCLYYEGEIVAKDFEKAFAWFEKAAAQAYAPAEHYVGYMYQYGRGTKKDPEKAALWFRKGEAKNDPDALNSLGTLYELGEGVPKNLGKAFEYYAKATKTGDGEAAWYNLGRLYENGKGTPENRDKAIQCYRKAASKGLREAKESLKRLGLSENP